MKVWVLLKWTESRDDRGGGDDATVHSVHADRASLNARIDRIARTNQQYKMRQLSENFWRIGPDDDEGFFGNRPVYLRAEEKEVWASS